jgi:hypothetical protein
VLIKIGDGGAPESFVTVAGIRARGSSYLYQADDQATDFPTGGEAMIEIAQLGRDGEPGAWTSLSVTIPPP